MRFFAKAGRLRQRLSLAASIVTGRWKADVAQRQAELETIVAHSPRLPDERITRDDLPTDLEAVLLHAATRSVEIERLSALYASLAERVALLEQALGRSVPLLDDDDA